MDDAPCAQVLYGDNDLHYLPTTSEAMRRLGPSATLRFVPRADHHLYIDNPDGFHELVERALA